MHSHSGLGRKHGVAPSFSTRHRAGKTFGDSAVIELLAQTDDQLALLMCVGAVAVSGLLMHVSFYLGQVTAVRSNTELKPASLFQPAVTGIPATVTETRREKAA